MGLEKLIGQKVTLLGTAKDAKGGAVLITADGNVILPRRSAKVKHAPLVYAAPSGWMASMNIDK